MSRTQFVAVAKALEEKVRRGPLLPDMELDKAYILERIEVMVSAVEQGRLPPADQRYRLLSRMAVEQWPLVDNPLSTEIIELERAYERLT